MAIIFHFHNRSAKECADSMHEYHMALVGSTAYIDNEIVLSKSEENKRDFLLIVGGNNGNDMVVDIGEKKI